MNEPTSEPITPDSNNPSADSPAGTPTEAPAPSADARLTPDADAPVVQDLAPAVADPGSVDAVNAELEKALDDAGDMDALMNQAVEAAPAAGAAGTGAEEDDDGIHAEFKRAKIAAIRGDDVFVDLMTALPGGEKLQGIVPLMQFERPPRIGSIMEFLIERINRAEGLIYLNREGAVQQSNWQRLERGMIVEARVTASNKGGLELEMPGQIRAFMPASQVDLGHVELESFVGQRIEARVHEVDRKHKRVIISRREHLQRQRDLLKAKTMQELVVDSTVTGKVTRLMDFGAFVDIGGTDGLLHIADMSHSRVSKASDVVKLGDQVEVKVLKIDKAKGRIALGLKQIQADPWADITFTVGEEISGRVTRTAPFGAFVEVSNGIEALLPISELAWKRVGKVEDVIQVDQVIKTQVIQFDEGKKKITLSLKAAQGDPWSDTSGVDVGEVIKGKVVSTTEFGAFVEIKPGVEGMVHISELANKRVGTVTEIIKAGDEKEFRVIGMDTEKRRIKLSLKQVKKMDAAEPGIDNADEIKKEARARMRPKGSLKGGMGKAGGLGMGLGDLKL